MYGDNDSCLIPSSAALQENITRAKAAEQEDAVKFMEKVKEACEKYAIISPPVEVMPPMANMPATGSARAAAQGAEAPAKPTVLGGLVIPGESSAPPPPKKKQDPPGEKRSPGGIIL